MSTCCLSKNEWNLWLPFIQLLTALNLQKNISFVGILHIILQLQQEQHNASAVNRETRWWWWCLQGWIRHACKENHQHPVQDFLRMSMKCPVPVGCYFISMLLFFADSSFQMNTYSHLLLLLKYKVLLLFGLHWKKTA